ncbi:MAG: dTDP-4-amino-4,6-dideoxyglucose formyltransferase [Bacteroidetes bacterium]|nr:dTDP-4-amino-4,6-dideoxyglucose formyltransferase [Bacteroidota bacterium]
MNAPVLLVLTDNLQMLGEFRTRAVHHRHTHFHYAFSPENEQAEEFIRRGCFPLNVHKDLEQILRDYTKVLSIHSKQVFPAKLVNTLPCYNLHPGLNPYNRGWSPQVFSILNKLPLGATLHEMVEKVDAGPIIDQIEVKVESWDTSETAYAKVIAAECQLLDIHLGSILNSSYSARAPHKKGNFNTLSSFQALMPLDLNETATFGACIDRLRALSHPPYWNAYFIDGDGRKVFVRVETFVEEE